MLVRYIGTRTFCSMWRIGMPSSSSASSNENEQPSTKVDEIVAPMLRHVGRLVHDLAVAPDAVARHVGADVEIGAERGDVRAADVGHADDRARFRIELAEAVKGAGVFRRQDRQIALDEAGRDAGGGTDLAAAVGEPRLAAREACRVVSVCCAATKTVM